MAKLLSAETKCLKGEMDVYHIGVWCWGKASGEGPENMSEVFNLGAKFCAGRGNFCCEF